MPALLRTEDLTSLGKLFASNIDEANFVARDSPRNHKLDALRREREALESSSRRRHEVEVHMSRLRRLTLERRLAELQDQMASRNAALAASASLPTRPESDTGESALPKSTEVLMPSEASPAAAMLEDARKKYNGYVQAAHPAWQGARQAERERQMAEVRRQVEEVEARREAAKLGFASEVQVQSELAKERQRLELARALEREEATAQLSVHHSLATLNSRPDLGPFASGALSIPSVATAFGSSATAPSSSGGAALGVAPSQPHGPAIQSEPLHSMARPAAAAGDAQDMGSGNTPAAMPSSAGDSTAINIEVSQKGTCNVYLASGTAPTDAPPATADVAAVQGACGVQGASGAASVAQLHSGATPLCMPPLWPAASAPWAGTEAGSAASGGAMNQILQLQAMQMMHALLLAQSSQAPVSHDREHVRTHGGPLPSASLPVGASSRAAAVRAPTELPQPLRPSERQMRVEVPPPASGPSDVVPIAAESGAPPLARPQGEQAQARPAAGPSGRSPPGGTRGAPSYSPTHEGGTTVLGGTPSRRSSREGLHPLSPRPVHPRSPRPHSPLADPSSPRSASSHIAVEESLDADQMEALLQDIAPPKAGAAAVTKPALQPSRVAAARPSAPSKGGGPHGASAPAAASGPLANAAAGAGARLPPGLPSDEETMAFAAALASRAASCSVLDAKKAVNECWRPLTERLPPSSRSEHTRALHQWRSEPRSALTLMDAKQCANALRGLIRDRECILLPLTFLHSSADPSTLTLAALRRALTPTEWSLFCTLVAHLHALADKAALTRPDECTLLNKVHSPQPAMHLTDPTPSATCLPAASKRRAARYPLPCPSPSLHLRPAPPARRRCFCHQRRTRPRQTSTLEPPLASSMPSSRRFVPRCPRGSPVRPSRQAGPRPTPHPMPCPPLPPEARRRRRLQSAPKGPEEARAPRPLARARRSTRRGTTVSRSKITH
jgi:hypothetical protein